MAGLGGDWVADRGRGRAAIWSGAAAAMVLPVLPERLSGEVAWDVGDFMFLAMLLLGIGIALEVALRASAARTYRAAAAIALASAVLSMWINLAVGILGSEDNPANLIFAGPIAIAVAGTLHAGARPRGMARVMVAAAVAQVATFVVALVAGLGFTGPVTVFFTALWLIAASLFRRSAVECGTGGI